MVRTSTRILAFVMMVALLVSSMPMSAFSTTLEGLEWNNADQHDGESNTPDMETDTSDSAEMIGDKVSIGLDIGGETETTAGVPVDTDPEEDPAAPSVEKYSVPISTWTVSGDKPGITTRDDPSHGEMVVAGGVNQGAILYQGAIGVGEVDLSQYSYAVVYCGCDASSVTKELYANSAITVSFFLRWTQTGSSLPRKRTS